MTVANIREAYTDIVGTVKDAWDNGGAITSGVLLLFQGLDNPSPPSDGTPWARVSVAHSTGTQAAIGDGENLHAQVGIATIELRTKHGDGRKHNDELVGLLQTKFRKTVTPNGVYFKSITPREQGKEGTYFRTDLLVEFYYDEVA